MERKGSRDIAVILNENARRVTRGVIRSARKTVPRITLYTSRTKEEGYQVIREVLDRGYRKVICGGGDGTLVHLLSAAKEYLEQKNTQLHEVGHHARQGLSRISLPELGILKLGTGNSLAPILGPKGGLKPVWRLARGEEFRTRRINLIEAEGRCFTFCGLGWDAQILNDYLWLKQRLRVRPLSRFVQGIFGYLAALAFRTLPMVLLKRKRVTVTARSLGRRIYRVRRDGGLEPLGCAPGQVFYRGPCHVIGAATTPYYGYRLKAFPEAMKLPGFMQIRAVKAGVTEMLSHIPAIWKGTYRSPTLLDFLAEEVYLTFSEAMPLQIGGDAEGYRTEIHLRVSQTTVRFLDFGRPAARLGRHPTIGAHWAGPVMRLLSRNIHGSSA